MADIGACLRCASRDLDMMKTGDGLWPRAGETLKVVCRRCSWQGAPLLFDDEEAYGAFAASVPGDAAPHDVQAPT